jgi:hypothetical protein
VTLEIFFGQAGTGAKEKQCPAKFLQTVRDLARAGPAMATWPASAAVLSVDPITCGLTDLMVLKKLIVAVL